MWFGPDMAYTTLFFPFWAGAADLPVAFQTGNPRLYDPKIAFWTINFVAAWARLNWQRMTEVDILPLQSELEARAFAMVDAMNARFCSEGASRENARDAADANATDALQAWTALGHTLIAKYSQGYVNPPPMVREDVTEIGYSASWLDRTDYRYGPTAYGLPIEER